MNSVVEHYESHLAPIYVWMAGGAERVNGFETHLFTNLTSKWV